MSELVKASPGCVLYTRCRNDVTRGTGLWSARIHAFRARARPRVCVYVRARARDIQAPALSFSLPLEGEEEGERVRRAPPPFSPSSFRFSHFLDALIPLTDRLTAVSHYGSIWSAFRNLVISFDRYNLDPAIAERLLKDLPPSAAHPAAVIIDSSGILVYETR